MLQNAYFLAKIGADTAENERNFAKNLPKSGNYPTGPPGAPRPREPRPKPKARPARDPPGAAVIGFLRAVRVSKIGKFCKLLQFFGGLVLGCIKAKFCKKICV